MLRKETTHTVIDREVVITTRKNSSIWQCVYKVGNKWQRTSTGERDVELAKEKAKQIFYKSQARVDIEYTAVTRKFRDVANIVLKELHKDFVAGRNTTIYRDYKQVIRVSAVRFRPQPPIKSSSQRFGLFLCLVFIF